MTVEITKKLERGRLILEDCRGQSMTIKQQMAGVQKRILDLNPLAVFVPCNNHSLSLVGVHAAHVNVRALTFFLLWNVCLATFHVQLTGGMF
jgi:hypothetical protein